MVEESGVVGFDRLSRETCSTLWAQVIQKTVMRTRVR